MARIKTPVQLVGNSQKHLLHKEKDIAGHKYLTWEY